MPKIKEYNSIVCHMIFEYKEHITHYCDFICIQYLHKLLQRKRPRRLRKKHSNPSTSASDSKKLVEVLSLSIRNT